jgi:hypothetical protein
MPWGKGQVVEEISAEDQYKEAVIQLIEWDGGGETLRFCQYWPDGRFQRQPMMIGVDDLPALRNALRRNQRLFALVRQLVEEP